MESIQLIKNRISSIASTKQITQSMRLVSTAKVKKARNRMDANAPFLAQAKRLMHIAQQGMGGMSHPYLTPRTVQRSAVIFISSDRGLCGGYTINVGKEAVALATELEQVRLITVGTKAFDYCRRRRKDDIARTFQGISENPFVADAADIAQVALDWFHSGEVDQIYLVSTHFENMLVQEPQRVRLLPLPAVEEDSPFLECEPGEAAYLEKVVPFYLTACIYGAMLESSVCEQSARITSMDSAVKNSSEMIDNLTLRYNQARQGAITQELIEIVSGAGAV